MPAMAPMTFAPLNRRPRPPGPAIAACHRPRPVSITYTARMRQTSLKPGPGVISAVDR